MAPVDFSKTGYISYRARDKAHKDVFRTNSRYQSRAAPHHLAPRPADASRRVLYSDKEHFCAGVMPLLNITGLLCCVNVVTNAGQIFDTKREFFVCFGDTLLGLARTNKHLLRARIALPLINYLQGLYISNNGLNNG
ncbi:hypothetical protein J6590_012253 [Homalodisca vitripennis]|nr:hypothetical protein J6590_012253 [Homalodisca vitripennis]